MNCPREHCHGLLIPTDNEPEDWKCICCVRRFNNRDVVPQNKTIPVPRTRRVSTAPSRQRISR